VKCKRDEDKWSRMLLHPIHSIRTDGGTQVGGVKLVKGYQPTTKPTDHNECTASVLYVYTPGEAEIGVCMVVYVAV